MLRDTLCNPEGASQRKRWVRPVFLASSTSASHLSPKCPGEVDHLDEAEPSRHTVTPRHGVGLTYIKRRYSGLIGEQFRGRATNPCRQSLDGCQRGVPLTTFHGPDVGAVQPGS